jgi:uncharacterized membrane protein
MLAFVGNNTWFAVLLVLHVSGAIIGLGPTFTFAILGPASGKQESPAASIALMEVMEKIERGLIIPMLVVVQLVTGILLIFNRSLDVGFFKSHNRWLLAGIGVYIVAMVVALGIQTPALGKMIRKAKSGQIDEEFGRLVKRTQTFGPILTLLAVAIMVLMIWKPGSGCGPLLRC